MQTPALESGRTLVITGPQGSGKTVLARLSAEPHGSYVHITDAEARQKFQNYLATAPAVLIIDDVRPDEALIGIAMTFQKSSTLTVNLKAQRPTTIKTPHLILVLASVFDPDDFPALDRTHFNVVRIDADIQTDEITP